MKMKRYRVVVKGRVQGVWYRQSTLEEAKRLGLRGWVQNLANGDVEILVEGEEKTLGELVDWCKNGPPLAVVEDINIKEEPFAGDLPKFYIKRS